MQLDGKMSDFDLFQETATSAYERLRVLFESQGDADYIGEPVSIIEHSLQAGFFTARRAEAKDDMELVLANLLHDVGHAVGLEAGVVLFAYYNCMLFR